MENNVEKNTNTTKYLDFEQIQQSIWILKQSYNKVAGFLSHPTTRIFRKSQSKYFVVYGIVEYLVIISREFSCDQ